MTLADADWRGRRLESWPPRHAVQDVREISVSLSTRTGRILAFQSMPATPSSLLVLAAMTRDERAMPFAVQPVFMGGGHRLVVLQSIGGIGATSPSLASVRSETKS
jgi:hypothetical protein